MTTFAEAIVEGDSAPSLSHDGTSRIVWSTDDVGRGVSVKVQPLQANGQFVVHRIEIVGAVSRAGSEDA
jgi:hypothetical protein